MKGKNRSVPPVENQPLVVRWVGVNEIHRYPGNPRKNEGAVAKVAQSIEEFGWRQPIVVDAEMVIVAGDTRYLAALHLGHRTVPVHVAGGLTPAQVKAYRLADNRVGEEAEWDPARLVQEFSGLESLAFDLALTGFSSRELGAFIGPVKLVAVEPGFEPPAREHQCPKCGYQW